MGDDESTVGTVSISDSSMSSANTTSPVKKRQLRFSLESNEVFLVTHIDDMDENEVFETWYEPRDYQAVKARLIPVIRAMMKGQPPPETNKQTIRGLEFRTREGATKREQNKMSARTAVLDEQERQRICKKPDDERISQVYIEISAACQEAAQALAAEDEKLLKDEIEEMRKKVKELKTGTAVAPKTKSKGINGLIKSVRRRPKSINKAPKNAISI